MPYIYIKPYKHNMSLYSYLIFILNIKYNINRRYVYKYEILTNIVLELIYLNCANKSLFS